MFTSLTEESWIATEKHEQCVTHANDCNYQSIGADCGKFSTTIFIREVNPHITLLYIDKTAQEAYDKHGLRAQGALDWIYKHFPTDSIHKVQQRVLSDLKRTMELSLEVDVLEGKKKAGGKLEQRLSEHNGVFHPLQPPAFEAKPGEFFCSGSDDGRQEPAVIWRRPCETSREVDDRTIYTYIGSIRHGGSESCFKAGEIIDKDGMIIERCVLYGKGLEIIFDFGLAKAARIKDVTQIDSKLGKSGTVYKTEILTKSGKIYATETRKSTAEVKLLTAKLAQAASH